MDFRSLVNDALRESGISLDSLTASNFAAPPDPMHTKFINWTAQAWEDIQMDRLDWAFMQKTGVLLLLPTMELHGADATTDESDFAAATFRLHNSANDALFTGGTFTLVDGTFATGDVEGNLTIRNFTTKDFLIEPGDLVTTATASAYGFFSRWGRYTLAVAGTQGRDDTADFGELNLNSVAIADLSLLAGQSYSSTSYNKLQFVPYSLWKRHGYDRPVRVGTPTKFTMSNDGNVEFYPPLDTVYNLYFEYTRTPQTLSAHTDTPTGLPSRFHKAIVWRALMYYAQYDNQPSIYSVAQSRYQDQEYKMLRDLLPTVSVGYDARRF